MNGHEYRATERCAPDFETRHKVLTETISESANSERGLHAIVIAGEPRSAANKFR